MKSYVTISLVFISLLFILPGCNRVVDWAKSNFYQGEYVRKDQAINLSRSFLQSKKVYDQFTTVGDFDALWLCSDVRKIYTDIHCHRTGKSQEQRDLLLRRQYEEINHFIAFYVLSLSDFVLGEKDSRWTVLLRVIDRVDGAGAVGVKEGFAQGVAQGVVYNVFEPVKIKQVELSLEYIEIFGKKYNKFKDSYLVLFNAKDLEDKFIISDRTQKILLLFKSIDKEFELVWDLTSKDFSGEKTKP